MEQEAASTGKGQGRAPPYHSFGNFTAYVRDLAASGIPPKIDVHSMGAVPDTVRSQLMTGFRFLGLVNGDDTASSDLVALVNSFGKDDWKETLGSILRKSYGTVVNLDLLTVTPEHLLEAFKPFAASDEVRRKCRIFFLSAIKEAGIPIGPRLMSSIRGSGGTTPRRKSRPAKKENGASQGASSSTTATPDFKNKPATVDERPARKLPDLISALVNNLPEDGSGWTLEEAEDWLQTAAHAFRYAYKLGKTLDIEIKPRHRPQS